MQFKCLILLAIISETQEIYDTESNRSSVLFERSNTHRNLQQQSQTKSNDDFIRISSLKELMRLFRINLKSNSTFEFGGQKYLIDLDDVGSPVSRSKVYLQQQPKSMPSNAANFSPSIQYNGNPLQQKDIDMDDALSDKKEFDINVEITDVQFEKSNLQDDTELLKTIEKPTKQTSEKEIQVSDEDLKDSIGALTVIIQKEVSKNLEENIMKEQQEEPAEVDNFYADIARQLALEIEREEAEQRAEEERLKKQKEEEESKKIQTDKNNHYKNKSEQIDKNLFRSNLVKNSDEDTPPSFKKSAQLNNIEELTRDSIQKAANNIQQYRRYLSMGQSKDFRYDRFAKLQQVNSEKQLLLERLNQANQLLESINQYYIAGNRNVAEAQLHLAFLFASPLVIRQGGGKGQNSKENFNIVPLLEFQREFSEIKDSIKETKRALKLRSKQATIENLNLILTQNPLALHFSGHGIENNRENFGRQHKQRQADGNYLLFETEDGEGELVSEKMLQEFIQSSNTNLEFVFVASCYSEFAGRIFLNAGAKHVICVKSGEQIADLAVITFSKCFYNSVFSQSMTICDAFKMAQKQVQVKYGQAESNKFSLLKETDKSPTKSTTQKPKLLPGMPDIFDDEEFNLDLPSTSCKSEEHKCKIFGPLKQGQLEFLDPNPRFKEYPAKVDNFIGRQKEMFEVIHNVINHRLVTLIGLPGIGKTSLSKNAVQYLAQRRFFRLGIVFMQLKGYINFDLFMKKLVVNFVMKHFELNEEQQKKVKESNTEQLLQLTLEFLKNQEDSLLIVFDNVEDLLYHDKQNFRLFVNDLLVECPRVHLLMTSRTTLGALQDVSEKILVLGEISPFFTVDLFMSRAREIPKEEIQDLLECQPENYVLVGDHKNMKNQQVTNLADHHLFKILGGNPHAIILAAPILIKLKLKDLYLMLNSKEMHEVLQVDGIKDSTVASLRLSLEASIQILEKENKESLQFFFLIGMLPGGIQQDEIEEIWGSKCDNHLENLLNLSLVQKKDHENDKTKYILPPFMNNYAEAKICPDDKIMFQSEICEFYAKICKQILDTNGRSFKNKERRQSELNHEIMEKLLKHENNIWACIYRMVESDMSRSQPQDQVDKETLNDDVNKKIRRFSTVRKEPLNQFQRSSTQIEIDDLEQTQPFFKNSIIQPSKKKMKTLIDFPDSKPFAVIASQTPKDQDRRLQGFNFSIHDNEQKPSYSVLPPTIREESYSQSDDESMEGDSQSPQEDKYTSPERMKEFNLANSARINSSQLQIPGKMDATKEQKLKEIIRNSEVNFQRPSQHVSVQIQMIKSPDIQKKSLLRRMTLTGDQPDLSIAVNKSHQSFKAKRNKIEELHQAEKLIIYYVMNLFLLHENDVALHMINDYAFKAHGSELYEANLQRILGLIYHNKTEIEKSLECFKKAKQLFSQAGSTYGVALCKFSIGYIYRSKITEFITNTDEDIIYKRSKSYFESALTTFKEINHIVGSALCHKQLSHIQTKLKNKVESNQHSNSYLKLMKQFSAYNNKKKCPYVERVHGPEISLMTEIVNDNESRDMFPPGQNIFKKKASQNVFLSKQDSTFPANQYNHQMSAPIDNDFVASPRKNLVLNSIESQNFDLVSLDRMQSLDAISQPQLSKNFQSYAEQTEKCFDEEGQKAKLLTSPGLTANLSTETSQDLNIGAFELSNLLKQKSINGMASSILVKMVSQLDPIEEEQDHNQAESQRSSTVQRVIPKKNQKQFNEEVSILLRRKSPLQRANKGLLEASEFSSLNKSAKKISISKSPSNLSPKQRLN